MLRRHPEGGGRLVHLLQEELIIRSRRQLASKVVKEVMIKKRIVRSGQQKDMYKANELRR